MSFLSKLLGGASDDTLSPAAYVAEGDPSAPVIDVRTAGEFAGGHLAGALHADVMAPDFADRIAALDLPAEGPVYLYCRSGNRSKMATGRLRSMGVPGAVNIGGFEALVTAGAEPA